MKYLNQLYNGKCSKIVNANLYDFQLNLVSKSLIHKNFVRTVNSDGEGPDQTAPSGAV